VVVRETKRAVTPWGGIVLLVQFLKEIRCVEALEKAMPIQMNSPNAIAPAHTFTAFLIAAGVGALCPCRVIAHRSGTKPDVKRDAVARGGDGDAAMIDLRRERMFGWRRE
jgi:hypothetical protein